MTAPAARRLMAIPRLGTGIGVHRAHWLMADILGGDWGRTLDAIKITGSNGKGATALITAEILRAARRRVGLYLSPHLYAFNERVRVDGAMISDADLEAATAAYEARAADWSALYPDDRIGAFEAFTTVALNHFAQARPDALVLEAGIGGRHDAVRAVPGRLAALTALDLEHTALIGETLEAIAYDKADLAPDGGELVVGPIDAEVERRLRGYLSVRRVTGHFASDFATIGEPRFDDGVMHFDLSLDGQTFDDLALGLPGRHQAANAAVAAKLARRWLDDQGGISDGDFEAALRQGLAAVRWPGRLERIGRDPAIWIDIGHTPRAVQATLETVHELAAGQPLLVICGVSGDKDAGGIAGILAAGLQAGRDRVICTQARHRTGAASRVETVLKAAAPDLAVECHPDMGEAISLALETAKMRGMTIYVAGGLFLAIEARAVIRGEDPGQLNFF